LLRACWSEYRSKIPYLYPWVVVAGFREYKIVMKTDCRRGLL
jgi:hypothetical protein